jgi:hypothetical protein
MRMLRWMSEVTGKDRTKNEYGRSNIGVASIVKKMTENSLKWFGHMIR